MRPRPTPDAPHSRWLFAVGLVFGWGSFLVAPLPGCESATAQRTRNPGSPPGAPPTQITVVADWNDVYAAAQIAAGKNETAITSHSETPTEQVMELRTVTADSGRLTARRDTPAPAFGAPDPAPIPIHLTCTVGLFGDAQRQGAILEWTRRRLEQLKGVDWAPVR